MAYVSYLHFAALLADVLLAAIIVLRNHRSPRNILAAALLGALALWSLGHAVSHRPDASHAVAVLFTNIGAIGWTTFAAVFLAFAATITGRTRLLAAWWLRLALAAPPLFFLVQQWRGALFADVKRYAFGWDGAWLPGATTWLYYAHYTLVCAAGLWMVHRHGRRSDLADEKQYARLIVASAALALAAGTLTDVLLRWFSPGAVPPLADVAALVWAGAVAYAIARYRFLSLPASLAVERAATDMSDLMFVLDSRARVVSVNPAAARALGCTAGQLQGRPFAELVHDPVCVAPWLHAPPPTAAVVALALVDASGVRLPASATFSALRGPDDALLGTVCTARDLRLEQAAHEAISKSREQLESEVVQRTRELQVANERLTREVAERRAAEGALRRSEEQLRQSQKLDAIGQLAGGIAHDFNNMLGAILGYADMIRRKASDPQGDTARYAQRIAEAAERSAGLTAKLLAFARKGKYESAPMDLHEVVRDVVALLRHSIDKRIRVELSLQAQPSTMTGDRAQVESALLNLALNARDAMPLGGDLTFRTDLVTIGPGDAEPHVGAMPAGTYLCVAVSDTGTGIDKQTRKHLFEPFFTTKGPGRGTGLGLASAYGTATSHGGGIEVQSEPGRGSTFRLYLPMTVCEPRPADAMAPAAAYTGTVLVIDDEELARDMVVTMLTSMGCQATSYADGGQAVAYFREHHAEVDLVLLDMTMPGLSGRECFRRLREIRPDVTVLACSGYAVDREAQALLREGAAGFLQKPFSQEALGRALRDAHASVHSTPHSPTARNNHVLPHR